MLELYHSEPNTFSLKPLIALAEKQAKFVSHPFEPTRFEQFAADFPRNLESGLQLEREGPVLVHDDTVISSSFFMLEYIAEALPGNELLPGNPYENYRARAWGQYLGLQLGPGVSVLGCAKYLAPALRQLDAAQLRAHIERIEPQERRAAWTALIDGTYTEQVLARVRDQLKAPVRRVEETLARTPWLAGASYSIADIDAFAMLDPLPDLAPELVGEKATPRLTQFLNRVRERPAVKAARGYSRTGRPQQAFVPGGESSRWG
jgi:glutathione S-transferase